MSRPVGAKSRTTRRIESIISSVAADDNQRKMLTRFFTGTGDKPPSFFKSVEAIAASVRAAMAGEDAVYITSVGPVGAGSVCLAGAALATRRVAEGSHRLCTPTEILDFEESERKRTAPATEEGAAA